MVCIAAFIILAIIGVFVAIISIFKPKVGKAYLKAMKKAWGCLWKKVRLQKCETGFKEDVKNTLLSRVIIKHPKWVKPLSIVIEVLSVVIVIIAIWALLTAIKSLLALWALGSCNVTKPSACSLGAEVCSIDESEPKTPIEGFGRWFTEWGEIFEAIPDKFRTYKAEDYNFNYINANPGVGSDKSVAADILDPGCSVCMVSYRNQKEAGFFENYDVRIVPFAIQDSDNNYKFANSEVIVKYMLAAEQIRSGLAVNILDRIFTGKASDGINYQEKFNNYYSREEATSKLESWLKDFGLDESGVKQVREIANYPETAKKMSENREIIENQLKVKGIPTMVYDGARHTGLWKKS
ncbi:MAG: hypothetical protein Q4B87_02750 [Candidatus Saccharibacteria bacterium]|nr:hypothetical protein [Candidatus Saccharibacteria bacterium]